MSNPTSDKKTIGLTPDGDRTMETLMAMGIFREKIDAAKFAMALAIREGIQAVPAEKASTIWNVGSFDSDGKLRELIPLLSSDSATPYRTVEALIDAGLSLVSKQIKDQSFDIHKLLT